MSRRVTTHEEFMAELNKDPKFREAGKRIEPYFEILEEITRRRKELNLTQQQLAEKLGDYQSAISRLEAGAHAISLEKFLEILRVLEAKVEIVPIEKSSHHEINRLFSISSMGSNVPGNVTYSETAVQRLSVNSETFSEGERS